ncbi:MAG: hypothetical protein AAF799_19090 [Myxococcota bacterium]
MQRFLPTFLCVALATGLAACDPEPVGPSTDEEQSLFDFNFRSTPSPAIPGYPGDGDLTIIRNSNAGAGGGDIIVFEHINVLDQSGSRVVGLTNDAIYSETGDTVLCTRSTEGAFHKLSDANGTVLYSAAGPWVFEGDADVDGMNPVEVYETLSAQLLVTFTDDGIVDGVNEDSDLVAESTEELDLATGMRKLAVAAMLEGNCGGAPLSN